MTLKTYIKKLSKIAEKYPKAEIVFTEEDNFTDYILNPKLGHYNGENFIFKEDLCSSDKMHKVNAILLS